VNMRHSLDRSDPILFLTFFDGRIHARQMYNLVLDYADLISSWGRPFCPSALRSGTDSFGDFAMTIRNGFKAVGSDNEGAAR
jgi:hypothetical protein